MEDILPRIGLGMPKFTLQSKLAPKDLIREARNKATEYLDREYYGLYEEVA